MFGKVEVLKFCFFIFDKDKNGYIEEDELSTLVDPGSDLSDSGRDVLYK